MKDKIMSVKQIAEISKIPQGTLRDYLCRYTFNKYLQNAKINNYKQTGYLVNKSFIEDLCNFLELKQRYSSINALKNYQNGNRNQKKEEESLVIKLQEENIELKRKLEMAIKQHEILIKKYHEVCQGIR